MQQPETIPLPPSLGPSPVTPQPPSEFERRCLGILELMQLYFDELQATGHIINKDSIIPIVKKLSEMKALEVEQCANLRARPSSMTKMERKLAWDVLRDVRAKRKVIRKEIVDGVLRAAKKKAMLGTLVESKDNEKVKKFVGEPEYGTLAFELLRWGVEFTAERHPELRK